MLCLDLEVCVIMCCEILSFFPFAKHFFKIYLLLWPQIAHLCISTSYTTMWFEAFSQISTSFINLASFVLRRELPAKPSRRTNNRFISLSACEAARHHADQPQCLSDLPVNLSPCILQIQKRHSSSSIDERPSPSSSAREYVESLHQNSRVTLLFGKNNVLVQPVTIRFPLRLAQESRRHAKRWVKTHLLSFQRDDMEAVPGYLSLHQNADVMTLKWTPNQLMNGSVGDLDYERRCATISVCKWPGITAITPVSSD